MNPLNEESKGQQPSKAPTDLSILNPSVTPTLDASTAEAPGPVLKPKSPRKRIVDETPKEEGKSEKSRRVGQRKARGKQLIVAQESTTPTVKPARAKRAQKQMDVQMNVQAEPANRPKRASSRKEAK